MTRRRPATTGPRVALTEQRIVDAAIEIIREFGYDAVSMRSLAARLDTGQASLYAHVHGKSDLDRLIVTRVLLESPAVAPDPADWREFFAAQVRDWLGTLSRYPGLAQAVFASLPQEPDVLARADQRLAVLRALGLDAHQAAAADALFGVFIAGRSLEDATISRRIAESGLTPDAWWAQAAGSADEVPAELPNLREMLAMLGPDLRSWVSQEAVQIILDGVQARYLQPPRPGTAGSSGPARQPPVITGRPERDAPQPSPVIGRSVGG